MTGRLSEWIKLGQHVAVGVQVRPVARPVKSRDRLSSVGGCVMRVRGTRGARRARRVRALVRMGGAADPDLWAKRTINKRSRAAC